MVQYNWSDGLATYKKSNRIVGNSYFSTSVYTGMKYFFYQGFGLFAEIGYGVSFASAGITIRGH